MLEFEPGAAYPQRLDSNPASYLSHHQSIIRFWPGSLTGGVKEKTICCLVLNNWAASVSLKSCAHCFIVRPELVGHLELWRAFFCLDTVFKVKQGRPCSRNGNATPQSPTQSPIPRHGYRSPVIFGIVPYCWGFLSPVRFSPCFLLAPGVQRGLVCRIWVWGI